jgi:hypothetical protein
MSGLDNLRSIFRDELLSKTELFRDNQPVDKFDTKLNYNETTSVTQTYGPDGNLNTRGGRTAPLLDSVLRGRVYEPIRFSQDFQSDNLFVKPETGEITNQLFKEQTFDPRATTPKLDTLYFNTEKSFNPATNPTDFTTAIGNNDLPYTPLTQLGGQFKENLSWENLYQSNHSPKDNPVYKGKPAVSYGVNVSRDNLKIGKRTDNIQRYGFDRGDEPYIISPIGDVGRDKNRGGRSIPVFRAITDGDRILNFLTSNEGLAFLVRQNLNAVIKNTVVRNDDKLERQPQRFGVTYNPLSSVVAAGGRVLGQGVPNVLTRKSGFDLAADIANGLGLGGLADFLAPTEYGVNTTDSGFSINDTFTNGGGGSGGFGIGDFIGQFGFGEDTVTPTTKGDKATLAAMISGDALSLGGVVQGSADVIGEGEGPVAPNSIPYGFDVESESEGMPFYFKDMRDSRYIFFRAFIEGLTENISPTYAATNYIGRSEPIYTYERGEREISMTLKLFAHTEGELNQIYRKMERLTSLCYPLYINEGDTGYGTRMKPPLTKLRFGELFGTQNNELMGYIKSLSYTVDQSSPYETKKGKRVPKHIIATIGYQVIHDKAPALGMEQKFYGINTAVDETNETE